MFSWFLKLLGINEDRPAAANNSLLNSKPAPVKEDNKAAEVVAEPKIETKVAAKVEAKVEAKVKPKVEAPAKEKPAKKPAKAKKQSLSDAYPDLKSNIVKILSAAGFKTKAAIDKANDDELLALKGIGKATLNILRK